MFSRRTAFPTFLIFSYFYRKHPGSPTKRRRGTARVEGKELDN